MSPSTYPPHIYRILNLTADTSAYNRVCCDSQFTPLYNQRKRLMRLREKLAKQRHARVAELRALEESFGIALFAD